MRQRSITPTIALTSALIASSFTGAAASKVIDLESLDGSSSRALAINEGGDVLGVRIMSSGKRRAFLYRHGKMTDLGTLGGDSCEPSDINELGEIVGTSSTASGEGHAFLYRDGVMTDLGTLGGTASSASAINDASQIVGSAALPGDTARHAYLYADGMMSDLGTLGGTDSHAYAINASGQIVGSASLAGNVESHAFLYDSGAMLDLGTLGGTSSTADVIADSGLVAGTSRRSNESEYFSHAFVYSDGEMVDIDAGLSNVIRSWIVEINAVGQIVANRTVAHDLYGWFTYGIVYDRGYWRYLGTCNGFGKSAGINDVGQIVGNMCEPYVYTLAGQNPLTLLGGIRGSYDDSSDATDINDAGQVVGYSDVYNEEQAWLLACPLSPRVDCVQRSRSSLLVHDDDDPMYDRLKWKWAGGPGIDQQSLGNPQSDTPYTVCIYDSHGGRDDLVDSLRIDPSPDWTDNIPYGWSYASEEGSRSGVRKLRLRTGRGGRAKVLLDAQDWKMWLEPAHDGDAHYHMDPRLTVQMIQDATETCWTSEFDTAAVNVPSQFKARSRGQTTP